MGISRLCVSPTPTHTKDHPQHNGVGGGRNPKKTAPRSGGTKPERRPGKEQTKERRNKEDKSGRKESYQHAERTQNGSWSLPEEPAPKEQRQEEQGTKKTQKTEETNEKNEEPNPKATPTKQRGNQRNPQTSACQWRGPKTPKQTQQNKGSPTKESNGGATPKSRKPTRNMAKSPN